MGSSVRYEDIESKELIQTERKQKILWKTIPRGLENCILNAACDLGRL